MDDILKRLGIVESTVIELRVQVGGILRVLPYLATKADVKDEVGSLRKDMHAMESRMIAWIVGTAISSAGTAFAIAKYFT